ncbi:MAG: alpha/beta hydrolase [Polyangiaceae bacterium]|nr:alpha/beta hydrolase [Polyangiaceae bacterium]
MSLSRAWAVAITMSSATLLGGCAQRLFYHPDHERYGSPGDSGLRFDDVRFVSADGTKLAGWFIPALGPAKGTVIHFHGNAQNMSAHWGFAGWLAGRGFNVFVFDYRGYGASEGSPEPKGVYEDSVAAIRAARVHSGVDPERLLLFGQSLGGTNAIVALGRGERAGVRAIAVEATFASYSSIASDKLPGAGLLMSDAYSADRVVAALSPTPLLLIHGTADAVIGPKHSAMLYAKAKEPKAFIVVPGGEHIEAMTARFGDTYRDELVAFFEHALEGAEPHRGR